MKKKNLKALKLNKKFISNLHPLLLKGGVHDEEPRKTPCKTFDNFDTCRWVCHTRNTFDRVCFEATFSTRTD